MYYIGRNGDLYDLATSFYTECLYTFANYLTANKNTSCSYLSCSEAIEVDASDT
jgi:hypothetical protein